MPPKIARLAGLGAFAACGGIALVFALFAYATRPTPWAGLNPTLRFLSWLGVGGVLLALLLVHVIVGRQLVLVSKGEAQPV